MDEYNTNVPWTIIYVEKGDFYFFSNYIKTDEMKNNILLSSVGTLTFAILRDIKVPNTLKGYEDLLKKSKEFFLPLS